MPRTPFPAATSVALLVASIQIALGLAIPWLPGAGRGPISFLVFVAIVTAFAASSAILFFGGRRDPRAFWLGAGFLLVGAAFARPLLMTGQSIDDIAWLVQRVRSIQVNALLPYVLWRFALEFPRITTFVRAHRLQTRAATVSFWIGIALIAANLVDPASLPADSSLVSLLRLFYRDQPASLYWPLVLALEVGACATIVWKARLADRDERRRVAWLIAGILVGLAPVVVVTMLDLMVPSFHAYVSSPAGLRRVGMFAYPAILFGPAIMIYSVLVHRALEVRVVVRKAIQYAFARYTLAALIAVPFLLLAAFLYRNRTRTIEDIFSGGSALVLSAALMLAVAGALQRRRVLRVIDRSFFREQYDARRILGQLAERSRDVDGPADLAELLSQEIGRAIHPESCCLFVVDGKTDSLVAFSPAIRALSLRSTLARRLARTGRPLVVNWEQRESAVHLLPTRDAEWLADTGFRLLIPLFGSTRELVGLLGLGEKRSELPYSDEDESLLLAIASSAALVIENRLLADTLSDPRNRLLPLASPTPEAAYECESCGTVLGEPHDRCSLCGGSIAPAAVPLILAGKYRLIQRIGSGGMGVVYRASDSTLGRDVAIKTLTGVSPSHAHRLRREARVMAAISHPNLAMIFSAETWLGTLMIIEEYLAGGTLAHRLAATRLPPRDAIAMGTILADVAARIHKAGILHRDIKPSNIGYAEDGTIKLLDFGLARIIDASRSSVGDSQPTTLSGDGPTTDRIRGTLPYLSPEAIDGQAPAADFDIWSICIVMYEAMTGQNPFMDKSPYMVIHRVSNCILPDIRIFLPDAPETLAQFFHTALSRNRKERPADGGDLRTRLEHIDLSARASVA